MQFLLLITVFVSFLPILPPGIIVDAPRSAALTWGNVALLSLLASLIGAWLPRRWRKRGCLPSLRWYLLVRNTLYLAVILAQWGSLVVFNWGMTVRETWGLSTLVIVDELLIISPLLVSLLGFWWGMYPAENYLHYHTGRATGALFWGRTGYVLFQFRTHVAMIFLPMLLYVAIQDTGFLIDSKKWWSGKGEAVALVISIGAALAVLIIFPWTLVRIWGTESMPAGPLRERLADTAKRLKFRYTDFRVWHTENNIANAIVTGVLPWPRYVIFSDGLLHALSPEEVVAVLGHEIGHIRRWHFPLYVGLCLLLAISGMQLLSLSPAAPGQQLEAFLFRLPSDLPSNWEEWLPLTGGLAVLWAYIWLVFGTVSRYCEREADVYGCLAVSCGQRQCSDQDHALPHASGCAPGLCPTGIRTFIGALEKVAALNGLPRTQWSWRHGSIARRIAYLESLNKLFVRGHNWPRWLWLPSWGLFVLVLVAVLAMHFSGIPIY